MSGVAITLARLGARPQLLALVPAVRIKSGVLPQGTPVPAISITSVVATTTHPVKGGATVKVSELVQITVLGTTYQECKAVMAEVRKACAAYVANGETLHLDAKGPDFESDAGLRVQTQDVRVTYDEATV